MDDDMPMGMPLDFVQMEFFTYGYAGVIFYQSVWPSFAIMSWLWFGITYVAIHYEDDDPFKFDFHVYSLFSTLCGVMTGMWLIWAFRPPRLIDPNIFRQWYETSQKGKHGRFFTPETVLYWVGALLMTLGAEYLLGKFSDGEHSLTQSLANTYGALALTFGILIFLGVYIWSLFSWKDFYNKRQDTKYLLPLALIISTPALYDYPFIDNGSTGKIHGFYLLIGLIIAYPLIYLYTGYVGLRSDGKRWSYGVYLDENTPGRVDRFISRRQAGRFLVLVAIIHISVMFITFLVDVNTDRDILPVVHSLLILTLVWGFILFAWGYINPNFLFSHERPKLYESIKEATRKPEEIHNIKSASDENRVSIKINEFV